MDGELNLLPSRNIQPCGTLDHHIHKGHKTRTNQHHSTVSYDPEKASPNSRGSVHKPCSSSHQPVTRI